MKRKRFDPEEETASPLKRVKVDDQSWLGKVWSGVVEVGATVGNNVKAFFGSFFEPTPKAHEVIVIEDNNEVPPFGGDTQPREPSPPIFPFLSSGPPPKLLEIQRKNDHYRTLTWMTSNRSVESNNAQDFGEMETFSFKVEQSDRIKSQRETEELQLLASAYVRKQQKLFEALRHQVPDQSVLHVLPLTSQEEDLVSQLLRGNGYDIVIDKFNIEIRRQDLRRLNPGQWLNDEIINFYLEMLSLKANQNQMRCHFFNSHFFSLLSKNGYSRVAKWTKSIDIFSYSKVMVPVHVHGNHWCLAVIHIDEKRFEYYDSLGDTNEGCLQTLKQYLETEYQTKKGTVPNFHDWTFRSLGRENPQQNNVYDCGVFMLKFAEFISQKRRLTFGQKNMEVFRKQIILQIAGGNLEFQKGG